MKRLTQKRLKEVLRYDRRTGIFTRRSDGTVVGNPKGVSYLCVTIDGVKYRLNRLAFLYVTGRWPRHMIDHINLRKADNAWRNLREATRGQNRTNSKRNANNLSGYKGVGWNGFAKKWIARIQSEGRRQFLGYFDTAIEAAAAYAEAAIAQHKQFART